MSVYRRRVMQVKHPPNQITAVYNVTSTTSVTQLCYKTKYLQSVIIDGESVGVVNTYKFTTTGKHEVKFVIVKGQDIDGSYFFASTPKLVSADLSELRNTITSANRFFYDCPALQEVKGMTLTKATTDTQYMFNGDSALLSVSCSNWDLSNVTNVGYMFSDCKKLESLDTSNWGLNEVTTAKHMFQMCHALKTIGDTSRWNLNKAIDCYGQFYECKALESLDASNWGLNEVTTTQSMFDSCSKLVTIGNTSRWNLSKVTNCDFMFYWCSALTELNVENWGLENTTTIKSMFRYCYALELFETSNLKFGAVKDADSAFYYCRKLTQIDLSNCDFSQATSLYGLFNYCTTLNSLKLNTEINANANVSSVFDSRSSGTLYYYPHASFVEKFLPIIPSTWTAIDITTLTE